MSISLKIENIDRIKKLLDRVDERKLNDTLANGVQVSSKLILSQMKDNTPVDTGALRDSEDIIYSPDKMASFIGPGKEFSPHYAPDVEFGHHTRSGSFVPGQHYVENTYFQSRSMVIEIFKGLIKSILK